MGQLELGANAVYFLSQDQKLSANSNSYSVNGVVGDEAFGAFPVWKLTMLTEYRVKGFTLSLNGNYIPAMRNELTGDITNGGHFERLA